MSWDLMSYGCERWISWMVVFALLRSPAPQDHEIRVNQSNTTMGPNEIQQIVCLMSQPDHGRYLLMFRESTKGFPSCKVVWAHGAFRVCRQRDDPHPGACWGTWLDLVGFVLKIGFLFRKFFGYVGATVSANYRNTIYRSVSSNQDPSRWFFDWGVNGDYLSVERHDLTLSQHAEQAAMLATCFPETGITNKEIFKYQLNEENDWMMTIYDSYFLVTFSFHSLEPCFTTLKWEGMTVLKRCWPVTDGARASVLSASTWKVGPFDFGLPGLDVKPFSMWNHWMDHDGSCTVNK